jgi:hypothetical protein
MAFCNVCGEDLASGVCSCNRCVTVADPRKAGNIGFPLVFGLVVLGLIVVSFIRPRFAHPPSFQMDGNHLRMELPTVTLETNNPQQAARDIGAEVYPGAKLMKDGAVSNATRNFQMACVSFESSDSLDKVASFFEARYPNARVTISQDQNHSMIVSKNKRNTILISLEGQRDRTIIQVTNESDRFDSSYALSN